MTFFGGRFTRAGFEEVILPEVWKADTFLGKIGAEKEEQMWTFDDRGGRRVCLVPEATGMIQELWNGGWSKTMRKPTRLFYVQRCFRYERPQTGRYRGFTQVGVEILGGTGPDDRGEAVALLRRCMRLFPVDWTLCDSVTRGIGYYVDEGFEVECPVLGAQKQVAGGGRYREGIGWAIGLERLLLAAERGEGGPE